MLDQLEPKRVVAGRPNSDVEVLSGQSPLWRSRWTILLQLRYGLLRFLRHIALVHLYSIAIPSPSHKTHPKKSWLRKLSEGFGNILRWLVLQIVQVYVICRDYFCFTSLSSPQQQGSKLWTIPKPCEGPDADGWSQLSSSDLILRGTGWDPDLMGLILINDWYLILKLF